MDKTLIFIPDVHSQHQKLEEALDWVSKTFNYYQLVLLGDVLDSRLDNHEKNYPPYSDPKKTFEIVRDLVDNECAILLQSNHQDKLRRWLMHHLEDKQYNPVTVNQGLDYTISQFVDKLTIEEKANLYQWLSNLPYHVVVDSYDLQHDRIMTFLCGHGYFSTTVNIEQPSEKHRNEALYGLLTRDKKRIPFWEADSPISFYGQPAIRVVGHHHQLWKGKHQRVLDGGCGSSNGSLCVHIPAYGLYQEF